MTYDSCYGCHTRENLIKVEDRRGRFYPMCEKCHAEKLQKEAIL